MDDSKEIGGYFALELPECKEHYHKNSIKLNTARNALEYILRNVEVDKIYMPYYNCSVMLEPLEKTHTEFQYYTINDNLEIIDIDILEDKEYILYINYFGIKNSYINSLIEKFGDKLIIDNSQSFFSKPTKRVFSIYSPRKFFGVSDGAYLVGNIPENRSLKCDISVDRMGHLLGRVESSAKQFYNEYKKNDDSLISQEIKKMSKLTSTILSGLDYEKTRNKRDKNFFYLHSELENLNHLKINTKDISGPMVYPLLLDKDMKNLLIKSKIYIATYWNDVLNIKDVPSNEINFVKNLIALPIDQRYNLEDMKRIVEVIRVGCE